MVPEPTSGLIAQGQRGCAGGAFQAAEQCRVHGLEADTLQRGWVLQLHGEGLGKDVAVGQYQWYHFGVGASGDWDVHWGTGSDRLLADGL